MHFMDHMIACNDNGAEGGYMDESIETQLIYLRDLLYALEDRAEMRPMVAMMQGYDGYVYYSDATVIELDYSESGL